MSLAFLAKKSWHTANINNQERVWLKEQEKEREKKKTELLQKQMKEEREMEELRQLQGAGQSTQNKLTWMYAPPINVQADADEYLMGKPKEDDKEDEDLKKVMKNEAVSQAFVEKQKDAISAYRDDMNKIRDDPLFAIKHAEKKQRERMLDNPLKELEAKRLAKEQKKAAKKEAKKMKKEGKRKHDSDDDKDDWKRRKMREEAFDDKYSRQDRSSGQHARESRHDAGQSRRSRSRDRYGDKHRQDNGAPKAHSSSSSGLLGYGLWKGSQSREENQTPYVPGAAVEEYSMTGRKGIIDNGYEAEFQSKMNKETFMASATTMEQRLAQRKHYRQRNIDDTTGIV
ncbi:hypothetical protein GUITHDRAFT_117357 [Guillardia theta CCMP2712]|uniref:CBF1-interacting co-repressor CIR N-terminal domain-containing protein n=1 Tax=Guillardia theta (strain CCMP2712) TaxID=905079 RepID=L1IJQ2_GUITC|nr:hypothetical protein GUITHDRAFT_117357 [Guillardia theta CCMP2712]EKX36466.1 hypothetical protein GUITHDRAFT_117357 [Guillardia theta CCMP2712]|eukprot:XP_005823446.1 hypothetical protein GUITHDRAFT_117357 [Guillardia theta CCMP2712]